MATTLANRYGQALADVVMEPSSGLDPLQVAGELRSIEALLEESAELRAVLLSPAVAPARKRAVMARLSGPLGLAPMVRNFVHVMIDRRRIAAFRGIREAYEEIVDARLGFVRAEVTSASGLDEEQRARIEGKLAALTGRRVRCRFGVEDDVLGGVVVRIGSTVYDGSIRGQLEELGGRLIEQG
jgi:F-type H+-transporting ATPase subunit delta